MSILYATQRRLTPRCWEREALPPSHRRRSPDLGRSTRSSPGPVTGQQVTGEAKEGLAKCHEPRPYAWKIYIDLECVFFPPRDQRSASPRRECGDQIRASF